MGSPAAAGAGVRLRIHRLDVDELAVLDLQDDGRLDRIPLVVDRDVSGNARKVLGRGNRVPQLRGLRRARAPQGVSENFRDVITEGGERVRSLLEAVLVVLDELLDARRGIVDRIMVGDVKT